MIVPKGPHLWRMINYVGTPLYYLVVWDVLVVLAYNGLNHKGLGSTEIPLALLGSVIGLFVGFRNNSSFARWWEARILWGSIVNNSRSLGRQVCAMVAVRDGHDDVSAPQISSMKHSLIDLQIAYVYALRQQLRGLEPMSDVTRLLSPLDLEGVRLGPNVALAIQLRIAELLRQARNQQWIDSIEWQAMDRNIDDLADAQGGAERIKNTPLPKQYDYFPTLFVRVYCILLPFGMVPSLDWFTPVGSTVVGFMFLAMEKIGRDLESPFDNTIHDIPMTSICRTIEINLRQMRGDVPLPEPVKPERGVLW